ncbi:DUF2252 family protein [Gordonia aurantiaca]|uniref:DUF2252 family protein n=1 Tax=Gordonia sp. B21 TaxID=3151852 RepID=UPI0032671D9E
MTAVDLAACPTRGERADPLAILAAQARTRVPELISVRHARMAATPFTFYRGVAALMADDLARTPNTGIITRQCGDAHLGNLGLLLQSGTSNGVRPQRLRGEPRRPFRMGRQTTGGEFRDRRTQQKDSTTR